MFRTIQYHFNFIQWTERPTVFVYRNSPYNSWKWTFCFSIAQRRGKSSNSRDSIQTLPFIDSWTATKVHVRKAISAYLCAHIRIPSANPHTYARIYLCPHTCPHSVDTTRNVDRYIIFNNMEDVNDRYTEWNSRRVNPRIELKTDHVVSMFTRQLEVRKRVRGTNHNILLPNFFMCTNNKNEIWNGKHR